jgi:hypothetical protein
MEEYIDAFTMLSSEDIHTKARNLVRSRVVAPVLTTMITSWGHSFHERCNFERYRVHGGGSRAKVSRSVLGQSLFAMSRPTQLQDAYVQACSTPSRCPQWNFSQFTEHAKCLKSSVQAWLHTSMGVQGRPLTSFQYKDMSLTEALPSVLDHEPGSDNKKASGSAEIGTALSIHTPHRVFSRFTSQDADSSFFLAGDGFEMDGLTSPDSPANPSPPGSQTRHEIATDAMGTARSGGRVQWRESTMVREYVPSPRSIASSPARRFEQPGDPAAGDSPAGMLEGVLVAPAASTDSLSGTADPCISRRSSNLSMRAGTFNEIMDMETLPDDLDLDHISCGDITRRVSTRHLGAGTFDQLLGSSAAPAAITYDDLSDPLPSRRTSNLRGCAGTFEEILESGTFMNAAPAEVIPCLRSPVMSLIDADADDIVPSRCASNMHERAGTFDELMDAEPATAGGSRLHTDEVAHTVDDTDAPSDDEAGELSGAISRRCTNMASAAGAFEDLVDEDGDELPQEEFSEASPPNSSSERVAVSFCGFISETDVLRASTNPSPGTSTGPFPPFTQPGVSLLSTCERDPIERGRTSVLHFTEDANLVSVAGTDDDWNYMACGMLSEVDQEMDESASKNPMDDGMPRTATGPGSSSIAVSDMPSMSSHQCALLYMISGLLLECVNCTHYEFWLCAP